VTSLVQADKNKRIQNPAGLLIYYLHNDMPIPGAFLTTRKRRNSEPRDTLRHKNVSTN